MYDGKALVDPCPVGQPPVVAAISRRRSGFKWQTDDMDSGAASCRLVDSDLLQPETRRRTASRSRATPMLVGSDARGDHWLSVEEISVPADGRLVVPQWHADGVEHLLRHPRHARRRTTPLSNSTFSDFTTTIDR